MALYAIKVQDDAGTGIPGVLLSATSPTNGPWQMLTDRCGYAFPNLGDGAYSVDFTRAGYKPTHRDWKLADRQTELILVGMESGGGGVLPAVPTRTQVAAVQTSLAGLTYQTGQYGAIPAWFYGKLNAADRAGARAVHRAAGDTHIHIGVSEAYIEPSTLWPLELMVGYDYAYADLGKFYDILFETIAAGFFIDLPLAGDGLSRNTNPTQGEYNDPQGNTYGFEWLMHNFERIAQALQGDGTASRPDLTPFICFRPGWDAVFYGWGKPGEVPDLQPTRVDEFGKLFRRVLPNGYLAIEHTPGNIPCGEGGADFAPGGLMQNYDTIMSEFGDIHSDGFWQVAGRMVRPYNRPADQPAGDDPTPPFYLASQTPRGIFFYVGFEPTRGGIYEWARGRCSVQDVQDVRTYQRAAGVRYVG